MRRGSVAIGDPGRRDDSGRASPPPAPAARRGAHPGAARPDRRPGWPASASWKSSRPSSRAAGQDHQIVGMIVAQHQDRISLRPSRAGRPRPARHAGSQDSTSTSIPSAGAYQSGNKRDFARHGFVVIRRRGRRAPARRQAGPGCRPPAHRLPARARARAEAAAPSDRRRNPRAEAGPCSRSTASGRGGAKPRSSRCPAMVRNGPEILMLRRRVHQHRALPSRRIRKYRRGLASPARGRISAPPQPCSARNPGAGIGWNHQGGHRACPSGRHVGCQDAGAFPPPFQDEPKRLGPQAVAEPLGPFDQQSGVKQGFVERQFLDLGPMLDPVEIDMPDRHDAILHRE